MADNGIPTENKSSIFLIGGFITTAILILGLWWQAADPKERLKTIENTAAALAKDISVTYVTIRAHEDLQSRLLAEISGLKKRDEEFTSLVLTKQQFDAWKYERDLYIASIIKRIDHESEHIEKLRELIVTRPTIDALSSRVDQLYNFVREIQKQLYDGQQNITTVQKSDKLKE